MSVQIYMISEEVNSQSFIHEEVCRLCALEFQNKGFNIEFDGYLELYVSERHGVTYYEKDEIICSICDKYLCSDEEALDDGKKQKTMKTKRIKAIERVRCAKLRSSSHKNYRRAQLNIIKFIDIYLGTYYQHEADQN